jgi:hypothetical protein
LKSIQTKNKDAKATLLENANDIHSLDEQIEKAHAKLAEINLKLNNSKIDSIDTLEKQRTNFRECRDSAIKSAGGLNTKIGFF